MFYFEDYKGGAGGEPDYEIRRKHDGGGEPDFSWDSCESGGCGGCCAFKSPMSRVERRIVEYSRLK